MAHFPGWDKASTEQKECVIRRLNGDYRTSWPFSGGPPVRIMSRERITALVRRRKHGLPISRFIERERSDLRIYIQAVQRDGAYKSWMSGNGLPDDIRRCRNERCGRFFLVPESRPGKVYHSATCGRNVRSAKSMKSRSQAERERKLSRVRAALEQFQSHPDQLRLAARRARVTPNFITYALRRREDLTK